MEEGTGSHGGGHGIPWEECTRHGMGEGESGASEEVQVTVGWGHAQARGQLVADSARL